VVTKAVRLPGSDIRGRRTQVPRYNRTAYGIPLLYLGELFTTIESHLRPLLSARGDANRRNSAEAVLAHPNMNKSPGIPGRWRQISVRNLRRTQITPAG